MFSRLTLVVLAYIRETGTLNPYVEQGVTGTLNPVRDAFFFSVIIPVKSFEQTLNSKSLQLYRQKSRGRERVSSTAVIIMF